MLGTVGAKEPFVSCPGNQLIMTLDICRSIKNQFTNGYLEHNLHFNVCVCLSCICDAHKYVYIYTYYIRICYSLGVIVLAPLERYNQMSRVVNI